MTQATIIALHVANAAARAREKVIDAFRLRGATAPERALPLVELGLANGDREVGELAASGVLRGVDRRGRPTVIGYEESRPEAFYLDEAAFISARNREPGAAARVAVIILVILLALLLIPLVVLVTSQR